ncbi:MAG TPA: SRPBCC family protein [Jatrophihabitantaceae bacterium]|jgi:uncharacterized protein YndB with AHSA1/START domain
MNEPDVPVPGKPVAVSRTVATTPQHVYDQLADGWLLPVWLVGAAHIRAVDATWPAVGSRVHHSVGIWPVLVSDTTRVVSVDPPHDLVLHARIWPVGEARVQLTMDADGNGTCVTMTEAAARGPARWFDNPVQRWWLKRRNAESLARLAAVAERRPGQRSAVDTAK